MGNCLSHNDPWSCFKQIQFIGKTVPQSSKKSSSAKAKNNSDRENVLISTNIGNLKESIIISAPLKSAIGSVPASGNFVTAVEDPKEIVKLQRINNLINVSIFTYKELTIATNHFSPDLILGEGGFGLVYKGVIDEKVRPGFKFTKVAVKELNPDGFQGDREWLAEINYLGQFSHPNLVKLVGYCCEDTHRLLVYEYMAYGSLETHLFRRRNILTWPIRMKIALDAAKGLAFLHGAERPIIYRDLKASNILLDGEFNAKLSDFGLAKEGPMGDQTHVSTRIMGTYGYADPEYVKTGHLTAKSDVYGFGVVLLEIMVGKRALDKRRPNPEHYLVDWARPLLIRATKLLKIIDPKMQGQYSSKAAVKIAGLAHRCLSENPKIRPLMKEVVELLETYNQEEMLYQSNKAAGVLQDDCKETINDLNPDIVHGKQANGMKNESPEKNIGIGHSTSFIADVNTRTLPESNNYER